MPGALGASKAGLAQRGQVGLDAVDKAVAVQEKAAKFEKTVDCTIARIDLVRVPEVMQRDGGDREVEAAADLLRL